MGECLKCGTFTELDDYGACRVCQQVAAKDAAVYVGSKECHRCGKELDSLAMEVRGEVICEKCQTAADFIL